MNNEIVRKNLRPQPRNWHGVDCWCEESVLFFRDTIDQQGVDQDFPNADGDPNERCVVQSVHGILRHICPGTPQV